MARPFSTPPFVDGPQTWWHWMDGNVSREGVTADLEAMREIGMAGATLCDVSQGIPPGPLHYATPEWFDMVKYAASEAKRLGLDFGVHNCAGWSSSGGPWIDVEHSMQVVTWSEQSVAGPSDFKEILLTPPATAGYYRDVALLAFPAAAADGIQMKDFSPKITASTPDFDARALEEGKASTTALLPLPERDNPQYVQIDFAQPFEARTLTLRALAGREIQGSIEISDDGRTFRSVTSFAAKKDMGGEPSLPYDFELPDTTSRHYRVLFTQVSSSAKHEGRSVLPIEILTLSPAATVAQYADKADYFRLMARAIPTTGNDAPDTLRAAQVVNLTGRLGPDGRLNWQVPPGKWILLRLGCTTTGQKNAPATSGASGYETDKFSAEATRLHWNGLLAKLIQVLGPLKGNPFTYTFIDSYEKGSQNWTPAMPQEFKRRRGYDLTPYLPVLTGRIVNSREMSERFLWDFRRTAADLMAENYYDYFGALAHQAGLKYLVESYGNGPFDEERCVANSDMPMGEQWATQPGQVPPRNYVRIASSSGHIYGKPIIGAESFTSGSHRWVESPATFKPLSDYMFAAGINQLFFHTDAHQPWLNRFPGMTFGPWGAGINRGATWYRQAGGWIDCLRRCQYLLRQGEPVADVALYRGEEVPSNQFSMEDLNEVPVGYDCDVCNTDAIVSRATVQNGRMVLPGGASYRVLCLPPGPEMSPALLGKLRQFTDNGLIVLGDSRKPVRSPGLQDYPRSDAEVSRLASALWDGGRILSGKPLRQVLREHAIQPDFSCAQPAVIYTHRRSSDTDIYFVANPGSNPLDTDGTFRVTGRTPEFWHPETGQIEDVPLYDARDGGTRVPLHLGPQESVFVVFARPDQTKDHALVFKRTAPPGEQTAGKLQIEQAVFGSMDGSKARDVRELLNGLVENGSMKVAVNNDSLGGDPAYGALKQLRLVYRLDGEEKSAVFKEGETVSLGGVTNALLAPSRLVATRTGALAVDAWMNGVSEATMASGQVKSVRVDDVPAPLPVTGPWKLAFPQNWGAPAAVTLDRLISWSEHPEEGIRYFSGTATYSCHVTAPTVFFGQDRTVFLDLGAVREIARLRINGKPVGVLWKQPFLADITAAAKPGDNVLEIDVTNLWPNRLIGDDHLPPDCEWRTTNGREMQLVKWPQWLLDGKASPAGRFTFTTWKFWYKDDPLLPSGLLGPVFLRCRVEKPLPL